MTNRSNSSNSNTSNTSNKAYNDDKEVNLDEDHPLTILKKKDPSFQLSFLLPPSSSQSQSQLPSPPLPQPIIKIAIWKDTRLEQLDNISKDIVELLHINGFTIERILEYGPLQIAKILGIDEHYAKIIFNEAPKRIN
jgi:hypothetical protein